MTAAYPVNLSLSIGNRCGHDPDAPRFFTPPEHFADRAWPKLIGKAVDRLQDYYRTRRLLHSLNMANGSARQQRTERAEACIALLSVMLHYTDLASLRVGRPGADGRAMRGITLPDLASWAGLTLRRAERACHDLVAAGLVKVHQPRQQAPDGEWFGLAAIRTISKHLFGALGLGERLHRERQAASKRLRERGRTEQERAGGALVTEMIRQGLKRGDVKPGPGLLRSVLDGRPPPEPEPA